MSLEKYQYFAKITDISDVYDGDTITADIDLGFGVWLTERKFRLAGINAPEIRGDERSAGLVARDFLREQIDRVDGWVNLKTVRDTKGKYGRYLAYIFIDGVNINDLLVQEGYAVYKEY